MNGSMVPIPDSSVTITNAGDGTHLSGTSDGSTFDEDFDKNILLTQVQVVTPTLKVLRRPPTLYAGRFTGLHCHIRGGPAPHSPAGCCHFSHRLPEVDTFQIPSRVILDIKYTRLIEIHSIPVTSLSRIRQRSHQAARRPRRALQLNPVKRIDVLVPRSRSRRGEPCGATTPAPPSPVNTKCFKSPIRSTFPFGTRTRSTDPLP